ncbi:MAG: alpha-mannosidase [Chloroflexi bacterium]|nr:alpha-mannosidase [Chloroflexota bacterium]
MHHHSTRWTAQKIAQRLALIEPLTYQQRRVLAPFHYTVLSGPEAPPPIMTDDSDWPEIEPNTYWAPADTNFVLQTRFQIPEEWSQPVALYLPLGEAGDFSHPEALVYIDGIPVAACDRHHQEITVPDSYLDGREHTLSLHGWSGIHLDRSGEQLLMRPCEVVSIESMTRQFFVLARVALGVANALHDDDPNRGVLLNGLESAFKRLDLREPHGEAFHASVQDAYRVLKSWLTEANRTVSSPLEIVAAGHAHIDVAWLWTLGQTRRKAGRTFHTVLHLMDQFPEYRFTQSQPQLYDYIRQDDPDLFAAIRERVAEGRWEPIGGMWVEADCNITGAEALARQFLLGRGFFTSHFGPGAESPVLWLPDVFGYTWSLPQLMKKAGLQYFMTIKIGWSQYNRLPYDSFWWQGLDGTRVLTHFSTTPVGDGKASNYNATATPEEIIETWRNFQQKAHHQPLLMSFGYGDGGGGPTREMLENIQVMKRFPGTPQVRHDTVLNFFRQMETQVQSDPDRPLPVWNGELYLEYHRGTYTTQSRNKRANRKSEFLLHDAEFLATLASILETEYTYPAPTLRKAWELVCLNQFHDIIPGSSITPVYTESLAQYQQIDQMGQKVRDQALEIIAQHIGGDVLVVNPTTFVRDDLVFWEGQLEDGQSLKRLDGVPVMIQATTNGYWIAPGELLPHSVVPLSITSESVADDGKHLVASAELLENDFVRVELNTAGDITRIYDKISQREVLPPDVIANQFQAFEDRPMEWDAWDVDIFYDDRCWYSEPADSVTVVERGPLRATLEVKRRILNSDYTQRISLDAHSPQLWFDTEIDWQERHILLKVAFPVEILTPVATYEIQWGNVQRPTHRNTSWDWARFETCAHKWVDLSEGGYGVSLLNDSKYGHDIRDNVMRISLLRSPTWPDPEADRGLQRFTYGLLPHTGGWQKATIPAAYALNNPLLAIAGNGSQQALPPAAASLLAMDAENVVIETVKAAEDGNGLIVRLYECHRQRGQVSLHTGFDVKQAMVTNLLEQDEQAVTVSGRMIRFEIKPYEIITLRLVV